MESTKLWVNKLPNRELLYEFITRGFFTPLLAQLLVNKGFEDIKTAYSFLYPQLTDFTDPFIIPDMKAAVERIFNALKKREKIGIYGDSDADGIIGSFVLYDFLNQLGGEIEWIIPSKEKEGYGFHAKFLPYFKEKGVKLVITVDVGISACDTVNSAKALGIDVIITDHHEVHTKPDTIVVSGKLTSPSSPVYHLCGAGVVFALIRALRTYLYHQGFFQNDSPPQLRKYLELVALATLADMVPITGENRLITFFGFRDLASPSFVATQMLLEKAEVKYGLSEEDVYYRIIPKINAPGRLGCPELAFNLLASPDKETAEKYLNEIEKLNLQRQELETEIVKALEPKVEEELQKYPFLLLSLEKIPKGLLGLIANRFKNLYDVPVVVLTFENGTAFASARSPEGLNFFKIISQCEDLLIQYGGHKHALGFQIKKELIPELKKRLNTLLNTLSIENTSKEYIYIDAEATLSELVHSENIHALAQLHPYGEAHLPPTILLKNFEIKELKILKDKHSKLILKKGSDELCAICFNKILDEDQIRLIAGSPFVNTFNNSLEIKIRDVR
jgi:single-stranded-DNA-specific exonuclease